MISRKGIELAISTLILLVIGVILLLGLVFMLVGGFERFRGSTDPFIDTTESSAVREACRLACTTENYGSFCCTNRTLGDKIVYCTDTLIDVECPAASCDSVRCAR